MARSSNRKRDRSGGSIKGLLVFLAVIVVGGGFFLVPMGHGGLTAFGHAQVWLKVGDSAPPPANVRPPDIEVAPNAAKSPPMETLTAQDEAEVQRLLREKTGAGSR